LRRFEQLAASLEGLTKLVVERLGLVEEGEVEAILATLRRLYEAVREPPSLVYVVLASSRSLFNLFMSSIHLNYEVASTPGFEGFEAAHDAYTGVPRLALCLEELRKLPSRAVDGVVLHEAAHTVLHGSLDSYLPASGALRAAEALDPRLSLELTYIAASSVKDWEATELLVNLGFREEAKAYALHALSKRGGLEAEWRMAVEAGVPLLHLAELLKPLCCASPLLSDEVVAGSCDAYLAHLPASASKALRELVEKPSWMRGRGLWGRVEALLKSLAELKGLIEAGGASPPQPPSP
jgi:hypothetical protein